MEKGIKTYGMVGIGALLHFLVDGLCICSLYLMVSPFNASQFVNYFVLYNVLAFLTQPLTGFLVDRLEHKHWILLASMLLLTLAAGFTTISQNALTPMNAIAISVLLGIGNSLFHVWGGQQVAVQTGNDIRSLGVFVSTGALGLAVGAVFFSWWMLYCFLLAACLLSIWAIRILLRPLPVRDGTVYFQGGGADKRLFSVLIFVVMAVKVVQNERNAKQIKIYFYFHRYDEAGRKQKIFDFPEREHFSFEKFGEFNFFRNFGRICRISL